MKRIVLWDMCSFFILVGLCVTRVMCWVGRVFWDSVELPVAARDCMMDGELKEGAWRDCPLSDGSELCGRN